MAAGSYLTQCLSDHIYSVVEGSELEKRCKKREAKGHVDAIVLYVDECPGCIVDQDARDSQMDYMVGLFGCPFEDGMGGCTDDCPCKTPHQDRHSPYEGQLTMLVEEIKV